MNGKRVMLDSCSNILLVDMQRVPAGSKCHSGCEPLKSKPIQTYVVSLGFFESDFFLLLFLSLDLLFLRKFERV